MRRIKPILFYGIMAVMTLLLIEGMAQAAYYIAYAEFNGAGPTAPSPPPDAATATTTAATDTAGDDDVAAEAQLSPSGGIQHPYYGYAANSVAHPLQQVPPPRREHGVVLIGLLGGSVSQHVTHAFRRALATWFRDNDIPLRPVVLELGMFTMKQPQQLMIVANTLSLGGEYDLIVNLDGYNELVSTHRTYFNYATMPFYPLQWYAIQSDLTPAQKLTVSRIYALRQRQQRLDAVAQARPWRWSALYGIVNRYLRERAAAQIRALNHELARAPSDAYRLERNGPLLPPEPDDGQPPDRDDLYRAGLRVWYRSSLLLAELGRAAGAEYYHFQQPNQYAPGAKPLSAAERAQAYDADGLQAWAYPAAYPLLRRLGAELRRQGVNYHDLTQLFAANRETLYADRCCHLNERGNRLLAERMVERLAPALRRRVAIAQARAANRPGPADVAAPGLDAAQRELSRVHAVNKLYFDVRLAPAAAALHYSRDDCRSAPPSPANANPFFVHITPASAADLRPGRAEPGFNRADFTFAEQGGTIDAAGRCVMDYPLPDYEIARISTGQLSPDTGQPLWQARITPGGRFAVQPVAAGAGAGDGGGGDGGDSGGKLRYAKSDCDPVHITTPFFLHITPQDATDLLPVRAEYGYNNYDFAFADRDGTMDNAGTTDGSAHCTVDYALPDYPIASVLTGQYVAEVGYRLWETRLDFEQP